MLKDQGWGYTSYVICGIDWVTGKNTDKNADGTPNTANDVEVSNMSLGASVGPGADDGDCGNTNDDAKHRAICRSVKAGVTYAVAAGNDGRDYSEDTPAAYDEVLTVTAASDFDGSPGGGATATCRSDIDDTAADFSNFTAAGSNDEGHTVAAPGVCIYSTDYRGGYTTKSGTSMATPHVAGTAALCIAAGNCTGGPAAAMSKLRNDAAAQPPSYGFAEDPHRATAAGSRYYGYLEHAGSY